MVGHLASSVINLTMMVLPYMLAFAKVSSLCCSVVVYQNNLMGIVLELDEDCHILGFRNIGLNVD